MKSESRLSGSLLPRSGNYAQRPPRGSRRAELMMTCLATRPHWLLASLFRFQGATTRHRHASGPEVAKPSRERRADTHSCLHHSRWERGRQERSCQSTRRSPPERTGHTTGCPIGLQAGAGGISRRPR
jgi:hypothetical protein